MSVTMRIDGLPELLAALRALPPALLAEANEIVTRHAEAAATAIRAGYEAHRVTGNLAGHVFTRALPAGAAGAAVEVRSTARHVHMFEKGTEARHYITQKNRVKKLVGRMPGHPTFIPAMRRERAAMYRAFAALLEAQGFEVAGLDLT